MTHQSDGVSGVSSTTAEWTPRRVQNLLLALGVGLLGIAAVIFVAVSWGRLGVGGRAAVLSGVTALAAAGAHRAYARRLPATAEAVALLTVGLALLDCFGAWASDLAGLRDRPGLLVAAATAALVGTAAGMGARWLPVRAWRLTAAALAQAPVPLLGLHLADDSGHPAALLAAAFAAQAVASTAVVAGAPFSERARDARGVLLAGAVVLGVAGTGLAALAAYVEDGSMVAGALLLLAVAAVVAVGTEWLGRAGRDLLSVGWGIATALLLAAAWAPLVDRLRADWVPPALAGVAALVLAVVAVGPGLSAARRTGPAATALLALVLPGLVVLPQALLGAYARVEHIEHAWARTPHQARDLQVDADLASAVLVTLLLIGAAALVASRVLGRVPGLTAVAPLSVAGAGLVLPAAAELPYAAGLASDLVVAIGLLAGGSVLVARRWAPLAWSALTAGLLVLGLAVAWSLAVDTATLAVLPVAAAGAGAVALIGAGRPALREVATGAVGLVLLLLVGEAGALTRYGGGGWPGVSAALLTSLVVACALASAALAWRAPVAGEYWPGVRRVVVAVAVTALAADGVAVAAWRGATDTEAGLAGAVVAAVLLAALTASLPERLVPQPREALVVAGAAVAAGVVLAGPDPDQLWLALLAAGVAAAVVALRADHRLGWLSGALLTGSSWVRLADAQVEAPEAYTVAPAAALLAVGWRRRVVLPQTTSWRAYGSGLLLGLLPSLARAVTDAGNTRPLLLGLAALAVLGLGVVRRLQAPLLVGAGVLAVDALVQLAPYLVLAYDVMPRWVTIGAVGLLLLTAGVTYEQRVRDLRRVGQRIAGLR